MIVGMLEVCHRAFYLRQCKSEGGNAPIALAMHVQARKLVDLRFCACSRECKHEIRGEVMHLYNAKLARATQGLV